MIGAALKPLLQFTILPIIENGNPADILSHLTPILHADYVQPGTNTRMWIGATGALKLDINPHDAKYPVKVRQVSDNALVVPFTPEAIKGLVKMVIENALAAPSPDEVVNQIKG